MANPKNIKRSPVEDLPLNPEWPFAVHGNNLVSAEKADIDIKVEYDSDD